MWLPARPLSTVIAFVCLYGFTSGIFISVTPAVVAQISPDDRIGARIGAFFTLAAVATLIGTPIAGQLLDGEAEDGYRSLILFAVSFHNLIAGRVREKEQHFANTVSIFQGLTNAVGGACFLLARLLCERDLRTKW